MAGDWLKMTVDLPEKPEVWQIAGILGIEADCVVGKLLKVWRWFDAHTQDGNAVGVTYALVDHVTSVTGFGEAMALCGWLEQEGKNLHLPNFSRHNGKTAKNRALTAKRVSAHKQKGNDEGNAPSVTRALPREEKRREDKEQEQKSAPSGAVDAPDPVWGTGLAFLQRKGIPERQARSLLGKLKKACGDIEAGALLATAEDQDITDPAPWLMASADKRKTANGHAPASRTLTAIRDLEDMKNGLADAGDHDRLSKTPLLELRAFPSR